MGIKELQQIEPGSKINSFRYVHASAVGTIIFRWGITPKSSDLSADDARAFVATEGSTGQEEVAVALEDIAEGEAVLGIEARAPGAENNRQLLRETVTMAMHESGVHRVEVGSSTIGPEALRHAGFRPAESGAFEFVAAA